MITPEERTAELSMLQVDLGLLSPSQPVLDYLGILLDAAAAEIGNRRITLDHSDPADAQLVVMYAAWRYRHRYYGAAMPDMVKQALYNRLILEAGGGQA